MDNSWQRKCDMTWQSSPSSSHQRPPQNHNQFQHQILNGNYHFHSSVPEKPTPFIHRLAPEASNPCTSNLGSYNLLYSELGSSFLSLLSGPPCVTRNEVPFGGNNFSGCAAGGEASLLSSGLLGQNLDNQNVEAGEDLGLIVPSKERATTNRGCNFGLNNVLQGAYSNLEKLELTKAGIHQKLSCSENRTGFSSPKVAYENGTTPFNVWKIHPSNTVGISQKVPSKTDPSVSSLSSNLLSGCPRVFCLGLSGDLLLSNTGLLGVLCSCHGLHMSISKFSEHSGICNINPGDAVRMDSGETIAQWRKAYFCKFGIRIPGDNSGWDWPQGLSATAGLMKRGPTLASMSTISVLSNQGSPFGASVQSENPWSHILLPKFSHTGQKVVDEFVHCEKQKNTHEQLKNTQERTNLLFKGLRNSSNNSLNFVADNQMIGHSRSGLPKMPNLVGVRDSYNFCGAISSYKDPFSKSGDSVFSPYLHNLKTLGKVNTIGRSVGSLVERDIASSNVELRLGQPSQHSQTSRSSLTPASDYHLLVTHGQAQKSLFLDQHVHKCNSTSTQESRQPSYLTGILSSSSTIAEEIQMDNVSHVRGVYDVPNTSQIELLKGDPPRRSVTSTSLTNLRSPCEETKHFKSMNDVINVNHVLVSKLDSESHPPESFPLLSGEAMDTRFSHTVLGGQKHDNVDQVGCTFDGLHGTSELNLGSHIKSKEKMRSFSGVAGDSDPMNYAAFCGKVSNMCESTGMMANEIDTRNMLNSFGQVSYPGQNGEHDPNVFRTITSTMDLGTRMSSEAVSMGISATNLIPIKSLTPSSNKENIGRSPYFVDENTKILASHPLSALCNQNLAICTSKAITEQEGSRNSCRKKEVVIPSSVTGTRKKGLNFENVPNASEVATNTLLSANMMFGDGEKLPSVTDTDKWCFPVPAVSQGWYCHGKDTEIQCQFKSDLQHTRQFFLRFGGNENVTASSEDGKCYQRLPYGSFQNKCICARNSSCLNGRHDLVGETSIGKFTEQEANAVGLVTPFFSPKRSENYPSAEKDNSNSFGQSKNMVQNMEKPNGNSFQWRDVPRKVTAKCSLMCEATNSFKGNVECSVTDATASATKCFEKSALHALKGQETSNISSGCSAPAVTEASVEVNNKDSSTVDAGYVGSADNHVVDEGSGIERCWSSDDDSERSAEFYGIASKYNLMDKLSSKTCFSNPSHDLRFRDSIKLRKVQSRTSSSFPVRSTNNLLQRYENSRMGKRRTVKWKRLDSSISASALSAGRNGASKCADDAGQCSQLLKNFHMLPQTDQGSFTGCPFSFGQHLKHRRSTLSSSGAVSKKRDLPRIHHIEEEKADSDTNSNAKSAYLRASKAMGRKRLRLVGDTEPLKQDDVHDSTCIVSEQTSKVTGVDCNTTSSKSVKVCHSRRRPVVCGKYGIISNANSLKPPKIVSLEMILKATSRFSFAESWKVDYIPVKESKKASCNAKKEINNEGHNVVSAELNPRHSEEKETASFLGSKDSDDLLHTVKKRRCEGNRSHAIRDRILNTQLKRKFKEVRKRSIYELTSREIVSRPLKSPILKNGISVLPMKTRSVCKLAENAGDERMLTDTICNNKKSTKEVNCRNSWDLDVFCCVCGSSNTDESNWLLECSRCEIKVHQACYGISKVPKALWHCRPCKTSSENIVCVLCGYGGGAMTRALRSGNIVKSLLKAWSIPTEYSSGNPSFSESSESPLEMMSPTKSVGQSDPFLIMKPPHVESHSVALRNTDISEHVDTVELPSSTPAAPVVCNSITAGVLDSTVKQWVHMVCGLWTPGTRCPNVDTMSAFDVSGACRPKQDVICSICQRSGGCCIECRVADCFVQFHPWCAHQKGLLQSEVEGIHGESVGFYGRCMLHARFHQFDSYSDHTNNADHGERVSTCARTEGYKGRKSDGFHHNLPHHSNGRSGCLVPQEQLNAWVHINGQKSCTRGPVKLPTSVIEDDCRKEYARYKQSRGWKHLVVYKSGIHGLGLYTSQFISRSAMVVEYVGEIVGLHVADRRETEYQAGKKLQYKTACYFFRIDKERIIDATRKGGIARFVNHSCLPNCVAKVISMRNEKKVVFFAERDIYPGEEVTYDYHFNHEDEGKKIPCYCNSNNCRRYLN